MVKLRKSLLNKQYEKLKPGIALLRKHRDYFSEDEKIILETLFKLSPKLKQSYQFSRELSGLFDSGFVEGFNNKVKVLKRKCYGLSDVNRLFQRIIIDTLGMERFNPAVTAF